jgi:16S rRNA (guanine527-N7)-methyltransferase
MVTSHNKALSPDVIRRALKGFQVDLDDDQLLKIQQYMEMLNRWNDKLNLTAILDPLEILHRHFCESMYAAVAVPIHSGRLADIGSGPGFPGLPLKILRPDLELFLVESNIKKGAFLAEIIRELELRNARVLINRYEELGEELAPIDFVCARAVGEFGQFLTWAASPQLAADRVVLWVGGRDTDEIRKSMQWEWQEPIPVPQSLRRYLLVGKKGISTNVGDPTNA